MLAEQKIRFFGKWLVTPLFSIGSGIISTVATSGLSFVAPLSLPWLIIILGSVFLAETAVWIFLFKDSVPDTLVDLFVKDIFANLSPFKKFLVVTGLFCSLGGGFTIGGLTFISGTTAMTATLGLLAISTPVLNIFVAGVLAVFGFIAITSLYTKWISSAIRNEIHLKIIQYFITLFTRDPGKSFTQQSLEVSFRLLFVSTIFCLSIIGTIATLGTLQKGLNSSLGLIPGADLLATKIASSIIAYGLTGIARFPLAIQSTSVVFDQVGKYLGYTLYRTGIFVARKFGYSAKADTAPNLSINPSALTLLTQEQKNASSYEKLSTTAKIGALAVHGFSFGALAQSGGGAVLSEAMTALHFPLPETSIDTLGQVSAMVSGGTMSAGIAAFSFFYKLEERPSHSTENQESKLAVTSSLSPANENHFKDSNQLDALALSIG